MDNARSCGNREIEQILKAIIQKMFLKLKKIFLKLHIERTLCIPQNIDPEQ